MIGLALLAVVPTANDPWPTVCAADGLCAYVTATPRPTWQPATATAWADEINQERWPGRTVANLMIEYSRKVDAMGGARLSAFVRLDNAFQQRYFTIARGTNDSQSYATNFRYDGQYNSEDMSITVDPGRVWRAGIALRF